MIKLRKNTVDYLVYQALAYKKTGRLPGTNDIHRTAVSVKPSLAAHRQHEKRLLDDYDSDKEELSTRSHKAWVSRLAKIYGLSESDYDALFIAQNGCCAICRHSIWPKKLSVDHNHATGEVRGLLCSPCNTLVGILEKGVSIDVARKYLDEPPARPVLEANNVNFRGEIH
jgi:hypothetical protein